MLRAVLFIQAIVSLSADVITWTGSGNSGIWSDYRNWDKQRFPGGSDVAVLKLADQKVTVDIKASVYELDISAGTLFQPNPFTINRLSVSGGTYNLDSGSGLLTITESANITSTDGFVFASGTLSGPLHVLSKGSLRFTGSGQKAFENANIVADGLCYTDSVTSFSFNSSQLVFNGGLQLKYAGSSSSITVLTGTGSVISGGLTIASGVTAQFQVQSAFNSIALASGSNLQLLAGGHTISGLTADVSSGISTNGGDDNPVAIANCNVKGNITVSSSLTITAGNVASLTMMGPGTLTLGSVKVDTFTLQNGVVVLTSDVSVATAQLSSGTLQGNANLNINNLVLGPSLALSGPTINVNKQGQLSGSVQVSAGLINIPAGATAVLSGFQINPANGTPLLNSTSFQNNGIVKVTKSNAIIQVQASGTGSYSFDNTGVLHLAAASFAAKSVAIVPGSNFYGESNLLQIGSITTGSGAVTLKADSLEISCGKSCPSIQATAPLNSISATAQ